MKLKRILLIAGTAAPIVFSGAAYALSSTTPTDYVLDVNAGQAQIKNDPVIAAQAASVKDGEGVDGQVDNNQADVAEAIDSQEADTGDSQTGEAIHGDASSGESTSSDASGSSTDGTSTTSSTSHNGGTN
jgi:hypothetical protein